MLANIYLDQLDRFVEKTLIPEFTRGGDRKRKNPVYRRLDDRIQYHRKRNAPMSVLKPLLKAIRNHRSRDEFDPDYRRLRYIRYADDFLLGFDGPKDEAEDIKARLGTFLRDNLKLELSPEKTLITHATNEMARFLGYDITVFRSNIKRAASGTIVLRVPPEKIDGKAARYKIDGVPRERPELVKESDFTIIALYGSEFCGFVQYYAYARNRYWLNRLQWVMETSMLKTLAAKHKSTVTKMAKRFQAEAITRNGEMRCFRTTIEREGKNPLVARFGGICSLPRTDGGHQ